MAGCEHRSLCDVALRVAAACALLLALVAPSAGAVSLAQRSPFAQGLWWQPDRPGEGYEIWNTAAEAAVLWYTYDDIGRPTWYLASGPVASVGRQDWPLLQFRWSDGAVGTPAVVGTFRIDVRHHEALDITWEIGTRRGTRSLQPMILAGVLNESDHSGTWFDPGNSGWGLTLTEQGDVLAGVLYTYDAAGAPTWMLGARRGSGAMQFHSYRGTCPSCAYRTPSATPIGALAFDARGETQATLRGTLATAMAAGVRIDGANIAMLSRPASWRAADRQLAHFTDATSLRAYLADAMLNIPRPLATGSFSASPPATPYSTTNLQESGVDEADLVKSDGRHVYTFAHGSNGERRPAVRIAEVGDDGAVLGVRGEVALSAGSGTAVDYAGLFLHGGSLVAITGTRAAATGWSPWHQPVAWTGGRTSVEVFDATTPSAPRARWRAEIDGFALTSRRIGDRLYIVARFVPSLPGFVYGATDPAMRAANEALLGTAALPALLPNVRVNGDVPVPALTPTSVHVPPPGTRRPVADMILVTAIDLASPRIAETLAVVGTADAVYASPTGLYVATLRYDVRDAFGMALPVEPPAPLTDVHRIALRPDAMAVSGTGVLEGYLGSDVDKAAFRLSEHDGRLRAVTSSAALWGGSRNRLAILEPSAAVPGLLRTVAYLPNPQRPEPLGKPGEQLYATRFAGDRLYAVTFRNVDPLYVVDLADSADPRIAGVLEVPGFSEYLHPLPNGLLLGFGMEAHPSGLVQGLKLSLFDVGVAGAPRALHSVVLGRRGSSSALLRSHRAFSTLASAPGVLSLALPARIHDGGGSPYSDPSYWYPWDHSGLMRFELRGSTAADARLVPLPSLVTHRAALSPDQRFDAAADDARSILFRAGTVYVSRGLFWRQDSAGNVAGPL